MAATRRYSETTIKQLFGLCGNQCAYPTCTNEIIAAGTDYSDAAVIGQICHIFAAADNGPRGKPNLTSRERNAVANLILMCGHHHPLVDKQFATYPAKTLKGWKRVHEAKFSQGTAEAIERESQIQKHAFLVKLTDREICEAVDRMRRARFLSGFPAKEEALTLAARVEQTELSGGSRDVRARALAWCARILSQSDTLARAAELVAKSRALASTIESDLAHAFIIAATDHKSSD